MNMSKDIRVAKTGLALLIITVISKAAAFLVTIVFSHFFGTDAITDAYYAAGAIPNLVNNSLSVCVLTLFIPVYTKCLSEKGKMVANTFFSNILNSFVLLNLVLFGLICFTSPILARLVAPGFDEKGLYHTQWMICLMSMSFPITIAANAFCNLHNANQKFILPSTLTLINHLIIIVATIIVAPRLGIYSYPFICTVAWGIQLVVLILNANGNLYKYKLYINPKDEYFRYMIVQSIPVMIATAADQINLTADNIISSDLQSGSLSCIGYAHKLFNSINGLITATLLTLYYPIISKQYAEGEYDKVSSSIRRYFDMMLFLSLPLIGVLIICSEEIIDLLLNHGVMDENSIGTITLLFIVYVSGLLFIAMKEFATRLYYVIGNTRKPTVINAICVCINIVLSLVLKRYIGIIGIALATTIATGLCALIECVDLTLRVKKNSAFSKYSYIDWRHVIEIAVACMVSSVLSVMVKIVMFQCNSILVIIICGCVYLLSLSTILLIIKNDYAMSVITHLYKQINAKTRR